MNLPTAQQVIQSLIKGKQDEVDALTLALSILDSNFAPDIQAIADAQKDADEQRSLVAELQTELEACKQGNPKLDQADEEIG